MLLLLVCTTSYLHLQVINNVNNAIYNISTDAYCLGHILSHWQTLGERIFLDVKNKTAQRWSIWNSWFRLVNIMLFSSGGKFMAR